MILSNLLVLYLPQLYALYQVFPDMPSVIDILGVNVGLVTNAVKLLFLWKNRNAYPIISYSHRIILVLKSPLALFVITQEAIVDWSKSLTSWERSVMKRQARLARVFTIVALTGILACVTSFSLMPLFGLSPRILNEVIDPGMDKGRFFPTQALYPFDAMASPIFEVMYIFNVLNCCICGICFVSPDSIFGTLILHIDAQFEILGAKMKKICDGIRGSIEDRQELFQSKLKQAVETHIRCIRYVHTL
ncbi:hypothetical protein QAD02_000949 [Eretmocerus hayati]|uniref:Uncharacterized protein n=1 Tax=Eretmocerus hayati TaxID=131215 RepID=A0ACC2NJG2_9HYME|nr:hypothetical protein QAD02_000949 [Eretmocerus hayati]